MSDTGYIYLSLAELQRLSMVHLISGVDEDTAGIVAEGAVATSITGYTEWIGKDGAVVTVGWDWQILAEKAGFQLRRISLPSSNVMLQSTSQCDLGFDTTALLLGKFVDGIDWQPETLDHISGRYQT